MNRNKYTTKDIDFLVENYPHKGAKFCSEKLNHTENSIRTRCSSMKLKVTKELRQYNSKLKTNKKEFNKFRVNPEQFFNPTDPIIIYILGLLWADGYIHRPYSVELATTYPDAEYLIPLFLKTGKWKPYDKEFPQHKTWKKACTIKTSNKPLVNFLILHDYVSKSKESADKILSIIPEKLQCYWFRGLLDGDGYIHTDNKGSHGISFSSSIDQNWNYLENLCKKLNLEYHVSKENRENSKCSSFHIYSMYKTIKFCEYIYMGYPEDGIGLTRKYNRFLQLKLTEEKNRYRGVCQSETGKWRTYTSSAMGLKPKSLGTFNTKEEALKVIEKFYSINPKLFIN